MIFPTVSLDATCVEVEATALYQTTLLCHLSPRRLQGKPRFELAPPQGPFGTVVRPPLFRHGHPPSPILGANATPQYGRGLSLPGPSKGILRVLAGSRGGAEFFACVLCCLMPCWKQEAPAIIESYYDERLVGCSGGIGGEPCLGTPRRSQMPIPKALMRQEPFCRVQRSRSLEDDQLPVEASGLLFQGPPCNSQQRRSSLVPTLLGCCVPIGLCVQRKSMTWCGSSLRRTLATNAASAGRCFRSVPQVPAIYCPSSMRQGRPLLSNLFGT